MRKIICTIVFIMNEIVFLCIIGDQNNILLGDLCVIRTYGDLALLLGDSTVIAALCLLYSKDWEW